MIKVFFNEEGFFIAGEGIEIARRCSPALTSQGDRIFPVLQHTYKILYLALCELRSVTVKDDVMVYGDTRIVDEINGATEPLDVQHREWLEIINRHVLPSIPAVVFFRKKPENQVDNEVRRSHDSMIAQVDRRTLEGVLKNEQSRLEKRAAHIRRKKVQSLKDRWFGGKNEFPQ